MGHANEGTLRHMSTASFDGRLTIYIRSGVGTSHALRKVGDEFKQSIEWSRSLQSSYRSGMSETRQ